MPFTVEVYDSKTGVCVDRIPNVVSIRTEGDFYFIYPSIETIHDKVDKIEFV